MKKMIDVAEISVSYQPVVGWDTQPRIISSENAYEVLKQFYPLDTIGLVERFCVLYLNQNNQVRGVYELSRGGLTGTVADVRLIIGTALKIMATSIILSHNHPSGNLNPSEPDKQLTEKIRNAARMMEMQLFDHLILSPVDGKYFSFAENNLIKL
jgi:DNA repair protein RadC